MKKSILSKTQIALASLLLISATFSTSHAADDPDSKVSFSIESFESDPTSSNEWKQIIAVSHVGKDLSSINIKSESEDVIVHDVDNSTDKRITFIPNPSGELSYSWPFTISYGDSSGHSQQKTYTARYRKGESPGFTITLDTD